MDYLSVPNPCNCCGRTDETVAIGIGDESGHIWTNYVCEQCRDHCTDDGNGRLVHMSDGWDGSPETFEAFRADPA